MTKKTEADLIAEWVRKNGVKRLPVADRRSPLVYDKPEALLPSQPKHAISEEDAVIAEAAVHAPARISGSRLRKGIPDDAGDDEAARWLAANDHGQVVLPDFLLKNIHSVRDGNFDGARNIARWYMSLPYFSSHFCMPNIDEGGIAMRVSAFIRGFRGHEGDFVTALKDDLWEYGNELTEEYYGEHLNIYYKQCEMYAALNARVRDFPSYRNYHTVSRFEKFRQYLPTLIEYSAVLVPTDYWPKRVLDYVSAMPHYERTIIVGLYEEGYSVGEIAKRLRVTASAVCQRRDILKADLVARFGDLVFHDGPAPKNVKRARIKPIKRIKKKPVSPAKSDG